MASLTLYSAIAVYLKDLWLIFAVCTVVFGIATFWLWMDRSELKRYASDILIRKQCYRKKKTLGTIIDKAGTKVEFVCETNEEEPGTLKSDHTLINPNLVSTKERGRLTNGIPTLEYCLPYHFPVSHSSILALTQLIQHVREKHKDLDWLVDDLLIIRLLFCSNKYLKDNAKIVISDCIKFGSDIFDEMFEDIDDITDEELDEASNKLVDIIKNIKKEAKITPAKTDVVYLADAMNLCNVGISGAQVKQMLIKQKIIDAFDKAIDLLDRYMPYLTILGLAAAAVLVTILVLNYVK